MFNYEAKRSTGMCVLNVICAPHIQDRITGRIMISTLIVCTHCPVARYGHVERELGENEFSLLITKSIAANCGDLLSRTICICEQIDNNFIVLYSVGFCCQRYLSDSGITFAYYTYYQY